MAALWQRWRGRPTVVLLFPSFFLCNFLSPRLLSVFFFVFSFPFCLLSLSSPPLCLCFPPSLSRSLFCFSLFCCAVLCGCDGEWQWLLDEEDDELTMALAVLVWLSPLLYSFLCRSPLAFPLLSFSSPLFSFHCLSLAFISQRMACGATSNLVTTCRGIVAVKHSP